MPSSCSAQGALLEFAAPQERHRAHTQRCWLCVAGLGSGGYRDGNLPPCPTEPIPARSKVHQGWAHQPWRESLWAKLFTNRNKKSSYFSQREESEYWRETTADSRSVQQEGSRDCPGWSDHGQEGCPWSPRSTHHLQEPSCSAGLCWSWQDLRCQGERCPPCSREGWEEFSLCREEQQNDDLTPAPFSKPLCCWWGESRENQECI